MVTLVPIAEIAEERIERLLDDAFGQDRHLRTAYQIRAGMAASPDLSFAAVDGDTLIGTIQCWPIELRSDDGREVPLLMLGPVAVDPSRQRDGLGRMLTARALEAAQSAAEPIALMLIGDPEYYGRFFGFSAESTAGWRTPGPVERHRLLARGDMVPRGPGMLGPRRTTT
ncbi:GNAT family N-acetyltransferase [Sphingomonas endolithica]|uniref:GNAT family N-acetyltransferase n=1 Tax=Sphingomonas endolithica TaxID=2972485 RepID=UPI0021AF2C1F|nr:N-acetyltransferase [Sphingomonas sp. ZFBP2030]